MNRDQLLRYRGYTAIELMIAIVALVSLIGAGAAIYAAVHFIAKVW